MKKLTIQDVEDGMILAKAVKDHKGKELYAPGTVFNAKIISSIFSNGITEVTIQTESDILQGSEIGYKKYGAKNDHELELKIKESIAQRFGGVAKSDPVMAEIVRVLQKFEMRKYGLGAS